MTQSKNIYRKRGTGGISKDGYLLVVRGRKQRPAHVIIVEQTLGRSLPPRAVVHHVNDDGLDNRHANLVLCPSQGYHMLLNRRTRALDACGYADWRRCRYCKKYGDPSEGMYQNSGSFRHLACARRYNRAHPKRA